MLYPQAGYGGVIIYCQYYDIATPSNSLYYTYDATCTLEVSDSCSVVNEGNGLNAVCPCCGSTYNLMDGFPINGEAPYALKEYNISLFDNMLHITN
jgi:Rieske Fe-S protein